MKASGKKYFILAIVGAVILGIGTYLLLNNYFERVEIIVANSDLKTDKKIEEKDFTRVQYYKSSLPEGYITDSAEVIGRVLLVERKPGDPITKAVFKKSHELNLVRTLKEDEVLVALDLSYVEPLVEELVIGSIISIVSTERDRDYLLKPLSYQDGLLQDMDLNSGKNPGGKVSIIDSSSFVLSENIMAIDGQLLIKNLEIVNIKKPENKSDKAFIGGATEYNFIFLKCNVKEAPVISRVTKDNDYKIFLQKS